jgi:hypothetical protein
MLDAGRLAGLFQDRQIRDLTCKRVQVDEIWSFTYAKAKNVAAAKAAPEGAGDTWTWTAICADTKLAISWLVGGRASGIDPLPKQFLLRRMRVHARASVAIP